MMDEQLKNIQIHPQNTVDQDEMKKLREELNVLKGRYSAVTLIIRCDQ